MAQQDDASAIAAVVDLFDENTRDLVRRLLRQALQDLIGMSPVGWWDFGAAVVVPG
jgi:hypothetical protein